MGLDMYLYGKRYLNRWSSKEDIEIAKNIEALLPELQDEINAGFWGEESAIREITIEIGYWRKANQIHNWFVQNVQNGNDGCGTYPVYRSHLEDLKNDIQEIMKDKSKAQELLPSKSGFFFGPTDYDEYYFMNLEATLKIIDKALKLKDCYTFEYYSSW